METAIRSFLPLLLDGKKNGTPDTFQQLVSVSPNQSITNSVVEVPSTGFSISQVSTPGRELQIRLRATIGVSGLLDGDQVSIRLTDAGAGLTHYDQLLIARPYSTTPDSGLANHPAYITGSPTADGTRLTLDGVSASVATHGALFKDLSLHVARYVHTAEMFVTFGRTPSAPEVLFGSWYDGSPGSTYVFYRNADGTFAITYNPQGFNGTTITTTTLTSTATVSDTSTEHHFAFTYDPAGSGTISGYLDGVRIITGTGKLWDGVIAANAGMWIARTGADTNPSPLKGSIRSFRWSGITRYSGSSYTVPTAPLSVDSTSSTLLPLGAVTTWADHEVVGAYVRVPASADLKAYVYNQTAARGTLKSLVIETRETSGSTLLSPINSGNPLFAQSTWDDYADANPDIFYDAGASNVLTIQYSGLKASNGDWGFGSATAPGPDGPWTLNPGNPQGIPTDFGLNYIVSNGSVLYYTGFYGAGYYHYYNDDNLNGAELMTSTTGVQGSWTARGTVVAGESGRLIIDPWTKPSWRGIPNELEMVTSSQQSAAVVYDRDVRRYYSRDGLNWYYGGKIRDLSLGHEQYLSNVCTGFGEPSAAYDSSTGTYLMMNDSGVEALTPIDKRHLNLVFTEDPGLTRDMTILPRAVDYVSGSATQSYQVFDSSPLLANGSLYVYHAGSYDGGLASEMHSLVHARRGKFKNPF